MRVEDKIQKKNIACHSFEDIQMYMICILSFQCTERQLKTYLCAISDYCGISNIEDWATDSDQTATAIWIDKSVEFIQDQRRDLWINYFKEQLIKLEEYKLINKLKL